MSLENLKPAGFTEEVRTYTRMVRPGHMYVQGFFLGEVGVWLNVDGMQTLIGFGTPEVALAEAEKWASDQLALVRKSIEARTLSELSKAAGL